MPSLSHRQQPAAHKQHLPTVTLTAAITTMSASDDFADHNDVLSEDELLRHSFPVLNSEEGQDDEEDDEDDDESYFQTSSAQGGAKVEEIGDDDDEDDNDTTVHRSSDEPATVDRQQLSTLNTRNMTIEDLLASDDTNQYYDSDEENEEFDGEALNETFFGWLVKSGQRQLRKADQLPAAAYKYGSKAVSSSGSLVWTVATSAVMLGIPLIFAVETERLRVMTDDALFKYQQSMQQAPSNFDQYAPQPGYPPPNTSGIPSQ